MVGKKREKKNTNNYVRLVFRIIQTNKNLLEMFGTFKDDLILRWCIKEMQPRKRSSLHFFFFTNGSRNNA